MIRTATLILSLLFTSAIFAQTTTTYNCTGGVQYYTVPPCVTQIAVTVNGGAGGGANGGNGATVTGNLTVTPGQTLQIVVGCAGGTGANSGGYGGGGNGQSSASGWPSYGGGGASYISTGGGMGGALVVAGGGGGQGGGDDLAAGGDAGCPAGAAGADSYGDAGMGGTSTAGGAGGTPWTAGGGSGQNGSFGQGGNGGIDINYGNNPGGGGGGGYYGGGGGGSDNISGTSFVGGGGGGAGSSLIPTGGGCTAGGNAGNGTIAITAGCETVPPTASNPATTTVQCAANVPAINTAVVNDEADNCTANPLVAFVSESTNGSSCPETITRTYSVTDDCGNSINVTHTIIIDDTQNPTGTAPANVTVQCAANIPAPNPAAITNEADNCTVNPSVTHLGDASNGNTCPEIITRTYRIQDNCGNFIDVNQTITVDDTQNPTGSAPANVTVQCAADVPAPNTAAITNEADNCTANPSVTHLGDASNGNTCPEIITRTYRIQDDCGNFIDVNQTITVDDTQNPTGTAPGNVTVQCAADVPAPNTAAITNEADNCTSNPSVTHLGDASNGNTCPEIITRTYRIQDDCGNFIDVNQTITVDDTQNPTGSAPADIIVQCAADVPAANPAAITDEADNCGAPTVTHVSDASNGATCPEIITRTYQITDDCGNSITVTQTITIDDTVDPTASNPPDINITSADPIPAPDPTVVTDEADNCGAPTVAHVSDVSDGNACPETITRTYSVTDACGNQITVTQLIIIGDPYPPTGTAPADITVECAGDVPAADATLITDEADNNGTPTVSHLGDATDGNTCPETITRTYRITDPCGNITDVTQTITIDDTTPPTATAPANITVQCTADVPVANAADITDEADNCTVNPTVTVADVSDGNTCPEVITRTYTITDDCGNSTDVVQTITIHDTTDPTASNPADINITSLDPIPAPDPAVVTDEADNCVTPTVAFVSESSDNNPCPETITRIYSVTDDCGNQITVTQLVIITDPEPPTGTAPADVTVECITDVPAPDATLITDEADNNGVPTVVHLSDVSDGASCPETITRTYRITDPCANFIDVTQLITVNDVTPPTGTAPADVTVQCIGDVPAADATLITDEADNCGTPTVAFVSDNSDGNTCPEIITRTYSITDSCGNVTNVTQTITVDDDIAPTATAPADITVQCAADVPAADVSVITDEADNCTATPTVTVADVSDGNTCPEIITRTFTITDDCGNSTDVVQTITIHDTTDPTASNPADINITTLDPIPAPDPAVVTDEADNCVTPTVAFVSESSDNNPCPETITRIYSVTDDCGNQITVTQLVIITDPEPPTGTAPADVTVECITDVPAPDATLITDEADNNGTPTVTHLSDVSDGNSCPETITRTYRITDPCANFIDVTQLITVNDVTPPTGTAPADVTVQCIGDVPAADATLITDEADNCGTPTVAFVSDNSDGNTCPETITRTYSITDSCGNVTNVTQTITVDDDIAPTATAPADITVQCAADVPAADVSVITDEADNCTATPTVTVADVSDGNTCPEIITRTFTITDDCGNSTDVVQTITIHDTTDPTASNPADINITTLDPIPAPDPAVVTDEADNCVTPTVAFVSESSDNNPCPETITRIYSVTDDCGNQITVTQLVIITDPEPPTGTAPADVTVECITDVPAPDATLITDEADNTSVPTVVHLSDVSDGNTCPETITRTYRITDECGNFIDVTQLITVNDVTPPTGTAPADVTVQCIGDVPAADAALITDEADNCTANPTVIHTGDNLSATACPQTIARTYSIIDDCGNSIDVVQTITINDDIAPSGTAPLNVSVECIGDVPAADPALITDETDNCTANPVVAHVSDVSDGNTCPETITRTYSITDDCGNVTNLTQTITVHDLTDPTASDPAPISVSCLSDVPAADPSVVLDESDNCTVNPLVSLYSADTLGTACVDRRVIHQYLIEDDCGNSTTVSHIINIDVTNPNADAGLDQIICEGDDVTLNGTASLNGGSNLTASWDQGVIDGVAFNPTTTADYTYTIEACGGECVSTDQMNVQVNPNPVIAFDANKFKICEGDSITFNNNSTEQFNCVWDFGDGSSAQSCGPITYVYNTEGLYDVSLTVTSSEGCTSSDTYGSYIEVVGYPVAAFSYDPQSIDVTDTEVEFDNQSLNSDTYEWNFGDFTVNSNDVNPTHVYPDAQGAQYTVTLLATSDAGCSDQTSKVITIDDVLLFYVPNVFTPDGNSINNTFEPKFTSGIDIYDFHLLIYNRWGEVVFESYDPMSGWDGTYGDGGLVADGVYVWQVEFGERMSDKRHKKRGHVTVLK